MKKRYPILIIIFVILFGLIYFSVSGIQTLSTDKKVYSLGEKIQIHWSDFSLEECTCSNKEIQIFKQETTGWEIVPTQLYGFGGWACVNGEMIGLPMHCDFGSCRFPKPNFKSGDFTWNSKIYERKGIVESCLNPYSKNPYNNELINRSMQSYDLKNAIPSKYKISFGSADKIIEIK